MRLGELIPPPYRLQAKGVLLVLLVGGFAAITWQVQDWRYGKQLAEQARLHTETFNQLALATVAQQRAGARQTDAGLEPLHGAVGRRTATVSLPRPTGAL